MSEPVTHAEIEDVLSSIRRLVSEDGRETPVVDAAKPAQKSAPRLVLTPSLRVADPTPVPSEQQPTPKPAATSFDTGLDADGSPDLAPEQVEGAVAEPDLQSDEPVAALTEQIEEIGEEQSLMGEDTLVPPSAPVKVLQQAEPEVSKTEITGEAPWHDPDATLFAAAGAAESQPEETAETSADITETSEESSTPISFADKIAALEAVIGQADEQWEPDGEPGEENAGTPVETLAWEDLEDETLEQDLGVSEEATEAVAEAEVAPELDSPEAVTLDAQRVAEQTIPEQVLDSLVSDEAVLDEDSLRELVSDIVREELQGALGERITRNVRKLVRREIQRALAVQDLG